MIIQCDQCSTRFRLDDAKLSRGPAKVRCSKCKHVFIVPQEEPATEAEFQSVAGSSSIAFDNFASGQADDLSRGADQSSGKEMTDSDETPEWGLSGAVAGPESGKEQQSGDGIAFQDFAFDDAPPADAQASEAGQAPTAHDEFDFSDVAQADEGSYQEAARGTEGQTPTMDEDSFGFDDVSVSDEAPIAPQLKSEPTFASTDDFAIDFGELARPEEAIAPFGNEGAQDAKEHDNLLAESLGLGKGTTDTTKTAVQETTVGDFELSFDADLLDFGGDVSAASEEKSTDHGASDFAELDFGDMLTPETPAKEAAKPLEQATAGDAPEETETLPADIPLVAVPQADDELPPLTIASRRKSGTLFPVTVVGGAIVAIVALAGFGLYFLNGPNTFTKLIASVGGSVEEEGSVTVRQVSGMFLRNKEAGELFIVKGEAVNGFKKPRASIQVKATIFGASGQALGSKVAYCGNNFTNEQLTTLPLTKIEEVMNNQFGDSLANLGVQPGKVIPFVVVFTNVPKEAVDYGVQVAGSTVAAQ